MADQPFKDYYKILGVRRDSSYEETRKAFREKARELHPDKNIGQPEGVIKQREQQMKDVADAWGVLSHEDAKAKYERVYQEHEANRSRPQGEGSARPTPTSRAPFDFVREWENFQTYWNETKSQYKDPFGEPFTDKWLNNISEQARRDADEILRAARQSYPEGHKEEKKTKMVWGEVDNPSEETKIKWGPVEETSNPSEQTIKFGKSYKPHPDIKWEPVSDEPSGEAKG